MAEAKEQIEEDRPTETEKSIVDAMVGELARPDRPDPDSMIAFLDGETFQEKACRVAASLYALMQDKDLTKGLVISLRGGWGTGKTTFIADVLEALIELLDKEQSVRGGEIESEEGAKAERIDNLCDIDHCRIMYFNPWIFSSREYLVEQFFAELQKKFSVAETVVDAGRQASESLKSEVPERMKRFCEALLKAAPGIAFGAARVMFPLAEDGIAGMASAVMDGIEDASKEAIADGGNSKGQRADELADSLSRVKRALAESLKDPKVSSRLIVIDNVDRLSDEFIQAVFQFIGAVMDLPKLHFVVLYDRDVVERALDKVQSSGGERYLDKLIDANLDLPDLCLRTLVECWLEEQCPNISEGETKNLLSEGISCLLVSVRTFCKVKAGHVGDRLLDNPSSGRDGGFIRGSWKLQSSVSGLIFRIVAEERSAVYEKLMRLPVRSIDEVRRLIRADLPNELKRLDALMSQRIRQEVGRSGSARVASDSGNAPVEEMVSDEALNTSYAISDINSATRDQKQDPEAQILACRNECGKMMASFVETVGIDASGQQGFQEMVKRGKGDFAALLGEGVCALQGMSDASYAWLALSMLFLAEECEASGQRLDAGEDAASREDLPDIGRRERDSPIKKDGQGTLKIQRPVSGALHTRK